MTLKLAAIALLSLTAAVGLPACANSRDAAVEPSTEETAQMDHGGMGQMESGGMMDHGSMDLGPADESFDLRFIDAMIMHHQGAVVMAEDAQQASTRPEIQTLASDIIAAQQTEIAEMQAWREGWYPDASAEPVMYNAEMGHMMPMSADMMSAMMMDVDLGTADDEYDLRFINAMIPHHEGALTMAQEALAKSSRPEIQELAEAIIASQQVEIDQMTQWRQDWYGQ
ncbi:DUF305 domain-containing protein [Nodosilinea sp. LEGE 06152]|uniref:DUF305 domain-containing protein n=1 Tax=Nodosilinea sp. LEGE 06152 TaxID=2777966 RepID=UPI00187DF063|nr:DUF305 domain-containing protein [Nodosilinea sp. LEGE 06152]MBE9156426.1 DUF305 domain-containing protein [Nodosilinea sp. LEGE 06152]